MFNILAISCGAALGANLRYFISLWAAQHWGLGFPYGTVLINITGSFLIGVILVAVSSRITLSEHWRLLLVTGLLGGFTTFSSYSYESYQLIMQGNWGAAAMNALGSVILGLCAVVAGAAMVRILP